MQAPALETLVDIWLAAYGEPHAQARADAVRRVWSAEGRLIDPPLESRGHAGISDMAATLQAQFPGHSFVRSTAIDAHHGFARYGWQLRNAQGATVLEGLDVLQLDGDGRIACVIGFFGAQPQPR